MVLTSMRIACVVSLRRKTSTGRMPTARGFALPNFSLARSGLVYELTETVSPSCLSSGSDGAACVAGGSFFSAGGLVCADAQAQRNSAAAGNDKFRGQVPIMICFSDARESPQVVRVEGPPLSREIKN